IEVLAPTQRDEVGRGIDGGHVAALPQRDPEPAALADRVGRRTGMRADDTAIKVDEWSGLQDRATASLQLLPVVAVADEADLWAVALVRCDEALASGDASHVGLAQVAEREARGGQLLLAEAVEEVALVLVGVEPAQEVEAPAA